MRWAKNLNEEAHLINYTQFQSVQGLVGWKLTTEPNSYIEIHIPLFDKVYENALPVRR